MSKILLTQHRDLYPLDTNKAQTFGDLNIVLNKFHEVVLSPAHDPNLHWKLEEQRGLQWPDPLLQEWLLKWAWDCELVVGDDVRVVRLLRELGWEGGAVWLAQGSAPRGGALLRSLSKVAHDGDVIPLTCSSELDLARSYFAEHDKPRMRLIRRGFDERMFRPNLDARKRVREWLGVSDDTFMMLYAGVVAPEKRVDEVVHLLEEVNNRGLDATLLIVGRFAEEGMREHGIAPVDLEPWFEDHFSYLEQEGHLRMVEWADRGLLSDIYAAVDVLVNFTQHMDETFGNVQIEAALCGTPSICASWGGLRDYVAHLRGCQTFDTWTTTGGPRFDRPAALQSILNLANGAVDLSNLRGDAVERHSLANYGEQLSLLIEDALDSSGGARSKCGLSEWGDGIASIGGYRQWSDASDGWPRYESLNDPIYQRFVDAYVSRDAIPESPHPWHLFRAARGHVEGSYFVPDDPIWRVRRRLSPSEAALVAEVDDCYTSVTAQQHWDLSSIVRLVEDGILGISTSREAIY